MFPPQVAHGCGPPPLTPEEPFLFLPPPIKSPENAEFLTFQFPCTPPPPHFFALTWLTTIASPQDTLYHPFFFFFFFFFPFQGGCLPSRRQVSLPLATFMIHPVFFFFPAHCHFLSRFQKNSVVLFFAEGTSPCIPRGDPLWLSRTPPS